MTTTRKPQINFVRATMVGRAECLGTEDHPACQHTVRVADQDDVCAHCGAWLEDGRWTGDAGPIPDPLICNLPPQATRQQCKDHAAKTGHLVRYVVEDVTVYERDEQ